MSKEHWSWQSPFLPDGEPIPGKTYRADGWQYVDLPTRLSLEMKDYFLSIIGDGNVVILAHTTGPDYWRGQLLISPDGLGWRRARSAQSLLGRTIFVRPISNWASATPPVWMVARLSIWILAHL